MFTLSFGIGRWLFDVSETLLPGNIYSSKQKISRFFYLTLKPWKGTTRRQKFCRKTSPEKYYSRRPCWSMLNRIPSTSMQIVDVCVLICLENLPKLDLFRKFTQNYLWWNSNPPITNSLRRRKTISDTRIGRLGVIVNFTIFSISFQIKTYQSLISQYFLKVFWNGCFPISYLLKWFICVYIVFWLILLEFRNKQFEINFLWISTLFFQFLQSCFSL